jgi:hypothetical protein
MPGPDLDARLSAAFSALGEPALDPDARRALGPALRRRRARRAQLLSGVGVALVVAGLAVGVPTGLRSAPKQASPARAALRAPAASCVEVELGATTACRGTLVPSAEAQGPVAGASSSGPELGPFSTAQPTTGGREQVPVGSRLVITLPTLGHVRWSSVSALPARDYGSVSIRMTRRGAATVAVVTVGDPGAVALSALGQSVCSPGDSECVPSSVTWTWVLDVIPK